MSFTIPAPKHDFDFDENTVFEYTHGDCWYLALALHHKINLPVVALWGDDEIQHVGVELPSGDIVDIEGIWSTNDWTGYWYDELDDCSDVFYGEPNENDDNWCNAIATYSEDMLTQEVVSGSPTLGETANAVIESLRSRNLL